jgi:subtilisin family serine protease
MKPAWSESFDRERLAPAPSLRLPRRITRGWAYGDGTGAGVKVAILDSGVDGAHPLVGGLAGGVALEADPDEPGAVVMRTGPHTDLYGHGTACAAIVRRLAPACEIYSVRVLGERLTGKAYVFAAAIRWCLDNGINVLNLSLSTANPDWVVPLHELCDEAAFRGVVLCCALNNQRRASFPSMFASVFSAAATDDDDWEQFAYNPTPPAEWGAPGIDVEVAWLDGSTIVTTGNSFAAPAIAGHAARVLGAHPGLTTFQVKTVLAALARNAADEPARTLAGDPPGAPSEPSPAPSRRSRSAGARSPRSPRGAAR